MVEFSFIVFGRYTMRYELEELLKNELRMLALQTRDRLNLTQKEMAKRLEMSESSYSDIETGKAMCSTLTTVLLLQMQEDPDAYLKYLQKQFENAYIKLMQIV